MRALGNLRLNSTIGVAIVIGAVIVAPLGLSSIAGAKTTSCENVTIAQVSAAAGVKATAVSAMSRGKTTLCSYTVGSDTSAVSIEVVTSSTLASFKAGMKLAKTVGQTPKTDTKLAPYPAYSTALTSAAYHYTTYSVIALKGSKIIFAVANYPLAKVEAIEKVALSKN